MKLIIGLGNPGPKYENTRHNAGYMILNALAQELTAQEFKTEKKFKADITTVTFNEEKLILAKPTTFMNLSGEAAQLLMQFYKIKPEDLWVVYDDLDLPLGQIRIRKEGGPGTHNGMKSLIQQIGQNFARFRIGIESRGATAPEKQDTSSFVLAPFMQEEQETAAEMVQKGVKAIKTALEEGITSISIPS